MSTTASKQHKKVYRYGIGSICNGVSSNVEIESECELGLFEQFRIAHRVKRRPIYFNDIDCYRWMFDFNLEILGKKYWVSSTEIILDEDPQRFRVQVWKDTTEGAQK